MTERDKQLADLEELRRNGSITEEEYQRDRARILNNNQYNNNTTNSSMTVDTSYLVLMHLSQFAGFVVAGLGFALPIILWAVNKEKIAEVDKHGKNILNFIISWFIYYIVSAILILIVIGIPMLIVLGILQFIFIIVAAIKANNNEFWKYPMTIPFFNIN